MMLYIISNSKLKSGIGRYASRLHSYFPNSKLVLFRMKPWEEPDGFDEVVQYKYFNKLGIIYDLITKRGKFSKFASKKLLHLVSPDFFHVANGGIGTVHDLFPLSENTAVSSYYPFYYRLYFRHEITQIKNLELVVVPSFYTARQLKRYADENGIELPKVIVIHHSVPRGFVNERDGNVMRIREELGLPKDKKIVINVAHDEPRKGLSVIDKIREELHKLDFMIITVNNKRGDKYFLGIDDELLIKLYIASDVYFAPSIDEGFNIPIIEALANSVPVVARDIPAHREIYSFNNGGILLVREEDFVPAIIKASYMKAKLNEYFLEDREREEYKKIYSKLEA